MRKNVYTIGFFCLFYFIFYQPFNQTMTYFPPDEQYFFQYTILDIQKQKEFDEWIVKTKTNEVAYLLQQTSLLYADGYFVAYYNDWQQDTNVMDFQKTLQVDHYKRLDAFALYHAEFHQTQTIHSIENMLTKTLLTDSSEENLFKAQLQAYKKAAFHHLAMAENNTDFVLLTDLPTFIWDNPIWNEEQKEKIAGHLTESIYKQYVTRLITSKVTSSHFIPAFVFDYEHTLIYFIFQLDEEWYYFKQHIPS